MAKKNPHKFAANVPSSSSSLIVTGGMIDIHDRRPVTLSPKLAREWLDPATPKERAEQMVLLQGEPTEAFGWFKVDRAIGNVRNQCRELAVFCLSREAENDPMRTVVTRCFRPTVDTQRCP